VERIYERVRVVSEQVAGGGSAAKSYLSDAYSTCRISAPATKLHCI
jgi:hypothetical protein